MITAAALPPLLVLIAGLVLGVLLVRMWVDGRRAGSGARGAIPSACITRWHREMPEGPQ